jgi:hypothetical protein
VSQVVSGFLLELPGVRNAVALALGPGAAAPEAGGSKRQTPTASGQWKTENGGVSDMGQPGQARSATSCSVFRSESQVLVLVGPKF